MGIEWSAEELARLYAENDNSALYGSPRSSVDFDPDRSPPVDLARAPSVSASVSTRTVTQHSGFSSAHAIRPYAVDLGVTYSPFSKKKLKRPSDEERWAELFDDIDPFTGDPIVRTVDAASDAAPAHNAVAPSAESGDDTVADTDPARVVMAAYGETAGIAHLPQPVQSQHTDADYRVELPADTAPPPSRSAAELIAYLDHLAAQKNKNPGGRLKTTVSLDATLFQNGPITPSIGQKTEQILSQMQDATPPPRTTKLAL